MASQVYIDTCLLKNVHFRQESMKDRKIVENRKITKKSWRKPEKSMKNRKQKKNIAKNRKIETEQLKQKKRKNRKKIKDNEELQKIIFSIHGQIKNIIGKKSSLLCELEKIEHQIDLLKREINEKVKQIDKHEIKLEEKNNHGCCTR